MAKASKRRGAASTAAPLGGPDTHPGVNPSTGRAIQRVSRTQGRVQGNLAKAIPDRGIPVVQRRLRGDLVQAVV